MAEPVRPGYWMHETTGALRPALIALLDGGALTPEHIAAIRAYLRQWIMAPVWRGPGVEVLRAGIERLTSKRAIDIWLDHAIEEGIDPL